jgi:hypothetical protein
MTQTTHPREHRTPLHAGRDTAHIARLVAGAAIYTAAALMLFS